MKARLPKGYGRPDPQAMMRQVQKMQDEIRAKQDELEAREYTGTASGEMVTVTMTGKHEVTAIKIKPEAVDPDDLEMLEDLIAAAGVYGNIPSENANRGDFNGLYAEKNSESAAKYTVTVEKSGKKYTCVFEVEKGEWTVSDPA